MQTRDQLISEFEMTFKNVHKIPHTTYYTGIDMGTSSVILSVVSSSYVPCAGAITFADVVRDGMVMDYLGSIQIVKELKKEIEKNLGTNLLHCSCAIPPNTKSLDGGAIKHVVQAAGFEVSRILDEPSAANTVLKIKDGVIVDIGGGTTGLAIVKDSEIIHVADEATGGTHFNLVLAGAYKMSYKMAESYKKDPNNHKEILPIVRPVIEKICSIIKKEIKTYDVKEICLVGGSSLLNGIEKIIEAETKITTYKPENPLLVTPLGIALNCSDEMMP